MPASLPPRCAGKKALVTGAARGLGEAIARMLARHGATLFLTDIDGEAVRAVAASLDAEHGPGTAHAAPHDVRGEARRRLCVRRDGHARVRRRIRQVIQGGRGAEAGVQGGVGGVGSEDEVSARTVRILISTRYRITAVVHLFRGFEKADIAVRPLTQVLRTRRQFSISLYPMTGQIRRCFRVTVRDPSDSNTWHQ